MARAKLVHASRTFPQLSDYNISRDNIITTLESLLITNDLVMVEGEDGIGKTTLLAEFALRHPSHSLCLFLSRASRWAYDPVLLRLDFCNQLQWFLNGVELADGTEASDELLRTSIYSLEEP